MCTFAVVTSKSVSFWAQGIVRPLGATKLGAFVVEETVLGDINKSLRCPRRMSPLLAAMAYTQWTSPSR